MIYAFSSNGKIKVGYTEAPTFERARGQMRPDDQILLGKGLAPWIVVCEEGA